MTNSYIDKFNILHTLETNDKQNILMGAMKDNPDEIVVINILNNIHVGINGEGKIRKALENLVHFEKVDERIVFVTKMKKGLSLQAYLEQENPIIDMRLSIAFQYLKNITRYDRLRDDMKSSLIDPLQIFIERGKLSLNELIIASEDVTEKNASQVNKKVGKALRKILLDSNENYLPPKITEFVEDLVNIPGKYKNLGEIYHAFKNLYLYDEKSTALIGNRRNKGEKSFFRLLSKIMLGILLAGTTAYASINLLNKETPIEPTAYFEKIKMKNQWQFINKSKAEGNENSIQKTVWEVSKDNKIIDTYDTKDLTIDFKEPNEYNVTLKVQDKNHQWSKAYTQKIIVAEDKDEPKKAESSNTTSNEKLEDFNMMYEDSKITSDYEVFRSGNYAMKFINNEEQDTSSISIKNLNLDEQDSMSMWMMADKIEEINVKIEGYKEGKSTFNKSIIYKPSKINTWDLVNIGQNMRKSDEVKITMSHFTSTLWLDDIEFAIYK